MKRIAAISLACASLSACVAVPYDGYRGYGAVSTVYHAAPVYGTAYSTPYPDAAYPATVHVVPPPVVVAPPVIVGPPVYFGFGLNFHRGHGRHWRGHGHGHGHFHGRR